MLFCIGFNLIDGIFNWIDHQAKLIANALSMPKKKRFAQCNKCKAAQPFFAKFCSSCGGRLA
jgi:hypothetical protein